MHRHDLDLIAAFAEGSLDDATEARALVESCEECRDEYQAQLAALEYLASVPRVAMSDLERAALHRDLWTELRSPPGKKVATPWWYRWSYVAAGLFVVLGLAGVLSGLLRGGGADTASVDVAETFAGDASSQGDDSAGGQANPLYGAESDGGSEGVSTTIAGAEEALPYPFADLADEARARKASGDLPTESSLPDDLAECLTRLGLDDQLLVDDLDLDQRYLVFMEEQGSGAQTVTFVAVDGCEVVYVDG